MRRSSRTRRSSRLSRLSRLSRWGNHFDQVDGEYRLYCVDQVDRTDQVYQIQNKLGVMLHLRDVYVLVFGGMIFLERPWPNDLINDDAVCWAAPGKVIVSVEY